NVVAIIAGPPVSLHHVAELVGQGQSSGILHVTAVDHIGQCTYPLARFILEPDRAHHLAIDIGGLLAAPQIFDRAAALLRGDPECNATASAAAIEPKHEAWLFRRSTMIERIHAECTMLADQSRRHLFD